MCYGGPSFTKPAHGYGQLFGDLAETLDGGREDEDWAGKGFSVPYEEPPGEDAD